MSRFDVAAIGETMLRYSTARGQKLERMRELAVHIGGAESNVCGALASLGRKCGWMSRLPDNSLGRFILRELHAAGIDTGAVSIVPEGRVGSYYVEFADPPRSTTVTYDRSQAAITELEPDEDAWSYILDTKILHLTGITAALSSRCRAVIAEAAGRAKYQGVTVSFDVNYRSKLWSPQEAASCLRDLLPLTDILICGESDARILFDLQGDDTAILQGLRQLSHADYVVLTRHHKGASALIFEELHRVTAIETTIVDRLGAGDAFTAGVLDGYLAGSFVQGLRQGTALSAIALSQHGDMLVCTRQEMQAILKDEPHGLIR